jgi:regulator of replication initiation timing
MAEPDVYTISIKVSKKADINKVYEELSSLTGFKIYKAANAVYLSLVEKEDIEKRPIKFIILEFKSDEININFTVSEDESSSIRKLEVLSKSFPIIEAAISSYDISVKPLISIIDSALSEMLMKFTREMKDVLIENDRLRDKIKELQTKIKRYDDQVKELTAQLYQLNSENAELRLRLGKYEKPSQEALEDMIVEWIKEHGGEIDLAEFSRVNKVPVPRIEETLNILVQKGYIKPF